MSGWASKELASSLVRGPVQRWRETLRASFTITNYTIKKIQRRTSDCIEWHKYKIFRTRAAFLVTIGDSLEAEAALVHVTRAGAIDLRAGDYDCLSV